MFKLGQSRWSTPSYIVFTVQCPKISLCSLANGTMAIHCYLRTVHAWLHSRFFKYIYYIFESTNNWNLSSNLVPSKYADICQLTVTCCTSLSFILSMLTIGTQPMFFSNVQNQVHSKDMYVKNYAQLTVERSSNIRHSSKLMFVIPQMLYKCSVRARDEKVGVLPIEIVKSEKYYRLHVDTRFSKEGRKIRVWTHWQQILWRKNMD